MVSVFLPSDALSQHLSSYLGFSYLGRGVSSGVSWTSVLLLLLSRFSRVRLCATPEMAAHQAPRPWDSPGKNTGVGCHVLLQCMKVKEESEKVGLKLKIQKTKIMASGPIAATAAAAASLQSCPTLCDPIDGSPPGSPIPGILQARILEWVAISFSNA